MFREDFEMLKSKYIYFDNGATSLKPKVLGETICDYYNHYSANSHRGDYDISLKVDMMYENTRSFVKELIHAKKNKEIIFTSGTTDSLNKIIFGYFANFLQKEDEVLITKSEHASNVLPWFELADSKGILVHYIPLDDHHKVSLENVKKAITDKTKVISIAHVSNVIGDTRPIHDIIEYAHKLGILVVIDGAQSVPHMKVDVQLDDIDFLAFSAHKMIGPTGVGVLYGKEELLEVMRPISFGGGMNASFDPDGSRVYDSLPLRLEAGTPNIAGVIGFGKTIEYLLNVTMEKVQEQEKELKRYAIQRLKEVDSIIVYNEDNDSGIVTFNYKDVFAQDLAIYLNKYNICVRAGSHCAKILKDEIGIKNTCRASFYFYNTKEEIDTLIKVLKNPNLKEEIL